MPEIGCQEHRANGKLVVCPPTCPYQNHSAAKWKVTRKGYRRRKAKDRRRS